MPFVQSGDVEEVDEEFREAIIGMTVAWKLLYVVYAIRNEEKPVGQVAPQALPDIL